MKAHKNLQKGMYLFQTNKFYHIFRYFTRGFLWFSFGHNEVSPVNVTFLSPNKKVTKEIGTGKALCVVLSTRHGFAHRTPKPPFPVNPSRPHSVSAEELNLETRHSKNVPIFAALRWYTKNDGRAGERSLLQMFFSAILRVQPLRSCAAMAMRTGEVHRRGCI